MRVRSNGLEDQLDVPANQRGLDFVTVGAKAHRRGLVTRRVSDHKNASRTAAKEGNTGGVLAAAVPKRSMGSDCF